MVYIFINSAQSRNVSLGVELVKFINFLIRSLLHIVGIYTLDYPKMTHLNLFCLLFSFF